MDSCTTVSARDVDGSWKLLLWSMGAFVTVEQPSKNTKPFQNYVIIVVEIAHILNKQTFAYLEQSGLKIFS